MLNPVRSAKKFGEHPSFDQLAKHLLELPDSVFKKSGKPLAERSLSAKIGMLNKGDRTWWFNRREEAKCLADALGTDLESLGLNQKSGRHIFDFAAFSALPVLDLIREDGWKIAEPRIAYDPRYHIYNNEPTLDAWLKSAGFVSRDKVEWLYVPDKVEYQLLTRKLAAACRHEVLPIKSHHDILDSDEEFKRVRQQESLILAADTSMTFEDVQTLADYLQGVALLIISSSQLPPPTDTPPPSSKQINHWTWTLLPYWRELLLEWVEKRIEGDETARNNSDFSSEAAQALLDKFDPGHSLFVSVEDVLVLCQALHEKSEKQFKSKDNDRQLLLLFARKESSRDLLSPLIKARWSRWDLAWAGELPQTDWIGLAKDLCKFNELTKDLIARGMTGYDFQRPIVIRLLVRSYLSKKIIEGDLASWAPACFDRQRRLMVDDALDAISLDELERVAKQFMQEPASDQNLGACEAIFTAIGRRIIRKKSVSGELSAFAGHLIRQLDWDDQDKDFLRPWSLQLDRSKEDMEWVSACWAWSLQPAPPMDLPPSWLFPGWSSPSPLPQTVPYWLNGSRTNHNYLGSSWERLAIPLKDFLTVVERWMETLEAVPRYENSPPVFSIALLACAARGSWPAEEWWWLSVIGEAGSPLAQQALLDLVRSEDPSVNRHTALQWWPSLVQCLHKKFHGLRIFSGRQAACDLFTRNPQARGYSELVVWVMEQLKEYPTEALKALQEEDRKFLAQHPSALPASFKRELLKWLAKDMPSEWVTLDLLDLLSYYGREVVKEMEVFLDDSEQLGQQAARHLWEWAPDRAKHLLEKSLTPAAAENLIRFCHPPALGAAIKLLKDDPQLLQVERLAWARRHLPDARQHAQELMQLIRAWSIKEGKTQRVVQPQ